MNHMMQDFVGKMEKVDNALEQIPGKTGIKIGAVADLVVLTSPVAAGLALGAAGVYGAYKLAKYAKQKEENIVDAEEPSSSRTDA